MDIERALVSKVVATGKLHTVVGRGITPEMFIPEEDGGCREAFDKIITHARRYGGPPSQEAVHEILPEFEFEHVQDDIEFLCDRFGVRVRKREAQEKLLDLAEAIDDPEKAEQIEIYFLETARDLAQLLPSEEVKKFSDIDQRREDYVQRALDGELLGIPFGFPTLDDWTGGVLPWEYVTCAAFSGVGKSTLLRAVAFNIYGRPDKDHLALYIPLEETPDGILSRFDAMATNLSYKKIKQLHLSEEETEHWAKTAENVKKKIGKRDIYVQRINSCTPDKVFAEITRYEPDICFIDYVSLMRSSRGQRNSSMWQNITEITQDLKQICMTLEVPILAAAQTNRQGAKDGAELDNIAQSISIVQDSDIIVGLYANEEMKEEKKMEMTVKKNREGKLGKIPCIWDHDAMVYREEDMADRFGRPGAKSLTRANLASKRSRPTRGQVPVNKPRPRRQRSDERPRPTRSSA